MFSFLLIRYHYKAKLRVWIRSLDIPRFDNDDGNEGRHSISGPKGSRGGGGGKGAIGGDDGGDRSLTRRSINRLLRAFSTDGGGGDGGLEDPTRNRLLRMLFAQINNCVGYQDNVVEFSEKVISQLEGDSDEESDSDDSDGDNDDDDDDGGDGDEMGSDGVVVEVTTAAGRAARRAVRKERQVRRAHFYSTISITSYVHAIHSTTTRLHSQHNIMPCLPSFQARGEAREGALEDSIDAVVMSFVDLASQCVDLLVLRVNRVTKPFFRRLFTDEWHAQPGRFNHARFCQSLYLPCICYQTLTLYSFVSYITSRFCQ
jgi:hypothetical protein